MPWRRMERMHFRPLPPPPPRRRPGPPWCERRGKTGRPATRGWWVEGAVQLVPGDGLRRGRERVRERQGSGAGSPNHERARCAPLPVLTFGLMTTQSVGSPRSVSARAKVRQMAVLPAPGGPSRKTDQRTVKMSRSWETCTRGDEKESMLVGMVRINESTTRGRGRRAVRVLPSPSSSLSLLFYLEQEAGVGLVAQGLGRGDRLKGRGRGGKER